MTGIPAFGMYRPAFERDSCGFGLIAQIDGLASHKIVSDAVMALTRLTHRGAVAADGKSGDGCGLLMRKPDEFLRAVARDNNIDLSPMYAAGTVFLNTDADLAQAARGCLEEKLRSEGLVPAGWRVVPTDPSVCGPEAARSLPRIEQVFVTALQDLADDDFERRLFVARRRAELFLAGRDSTFYVASLSSATLGYKALVMPGVLSRFYPDLADPRMQTAVAIFHQRFSTNTLPRWRLAQPFRFLAHNGEINTIKGNRNWALARAGVLRSPLVPQLEELAPLVAQEGSDSSSLDNMLEVLLHGGLDIMHALRLLIPPAWQSVDTVSAELRAFYEYYGMHMEPWDGPAGLVLCDRRYAVCGLDRNGLRPARYSISRDRHITIGSETGIAGYPDEEIVAKGRLGPGEMLVIDTESGEILDNTEVNHRLSTRAPFSQWLKEGVVYLDAELVDHRVVQEPMSKTQLNTYQKLFGVTYEERTDVLRVLALNEQEAVASMGDDTPLAVLSRQVRPLFDYFRQQFAQVTNPPIDPLRERLVMSLETQIGPECNVFEAKPEHARRIVMSSPVLSERKFGQIMDMAENGYGHAIIDINYSREESLEVAIDHVCRQAAAAAESGHVVIVLSDRNVRPDRLPIHALLAVGAVHQSLIRAGLRCRCNLILETATARDAHHFACLIGYGATAVFPYLAYECLHDMRRSGHIGAEHDRSQLGRGYRRGIRKGLFKIMSKMGISTIASYRGAQLFELVGIGSRVVNRCFAGSVSRIEGAGFAELEQDQRILAAAAWDTRAELDQGGLARYRYGGEYHAYNPDVVSLLIQAVQNCDRDAYRQYAAHVNERPVSQLRDMMELVSPHEPAPLDEVEPMESIVKRFDSAGMSLGALSPEAHEALAIAMNRLGARSNSGEGGEDPDRHGTERMSKIKQVASGRFGVTPEYLVNAEVLQIKIAQGAKPGEGGQLPGHKVNTMIARLRFALPGIGLISPPPHHDIYSIEDLAQLIFDLKQVNPSALVSVKLVSAPGVGTVAAGVAKAYADLITISGYDGGTGASPLTSIKYAGGPWELGLAETHQTLRVNDLRDKVRLQTDGGLKTGLDVVKAAILGAESFGFGTAPMIALGCKYLRICHLNNCATGVATQNEVLRLKHFIGLPEMVMNYFIYVAEETREIMASLGVRRFEDLIGNTDMLRALSGDTPKQRRLVLDGLLNENGLTAAKPRFCATPSNPPFDKGRLAEKIVADTADAIASKSGGEFAYAISNNHRSTGARLSGEIARTHGNYGMQDAPVTLRFSGTAGQSFGVWNAAGLNMYLTGDANDYVGKGMAGGRLVLAPPEGALFSGKDTAIMGNTCLYGATGGLLLAAGRAGERFAVRNSGAVAVVEGAGDHCCEYMTGGVVTILGPTGVNFGAGMTGGFAYVLDSGRQFVDRYNHASVDIHRLNPESMEAHVHHLRGMIQLHQDETHSAWAADILNNFRDHLGDFWMVKPKAADLATLLDSMQQAA